MLGPDGRFKNLIFTIQNSVSPTSHTLSRRFFFYTTRWDRAQGEVDEVDAAETQGPSTTLRASHENFARDDRAVGDFLALGMTVLEWYNVSRSG